MADENEIYQKKNGFILYKNYIKTVNKMTNEQAGELFKIILHYANTGELLRSEDPRVDTALDFIGERLEFDIQKYLDTCEKRKEAGAKGGSAGKKEQADEAAEETDAAEKQTKANRSAKKQRQANTSKTPDTDTETDTDTEIDTDTDTETEKHQTCSSSTGGKRACVKGRRDDGLLIYGEEQYPVLEADIDKNEALTRELHRQYLHTVPSAYDYESVFRRVYVRTELPEGAVCAAFDMQKADLLRHAFGEAASAHKVNWRYIDGILSHYEDYGIRTVEEAVQHEGRWKRGEIA